MSVCKTKQGFTVQAIAGSHVALRDPLGDDPLMITGSANFSQASTVSNDENMLVIRGNQRVYFSGGD